MNVCGQASRHLYIFPKGKLPRFSHDQLKISSSPRYLHYDWVDRRWLDAPIYTLKIGLLVVTSFVHLWFHNTKIKGSTMLHPTIERWYMNQVAVNKYDLTYWFRFYGIWTLKFSIRCLFKYWHVPWGMGTMKIAPYMFTLKNHFHSNNNNHVLWYYFLWPQMTKFRDKMTI